MQNIIPKEQWKPYPTNPDEWKARVPEPNLKKIVDDATKMLNYKFENISS